MTNTPVRSMPRRALLRLAACIASAMAWRPTGASRTDLLKAYEGMSAPLVGNPLELPVIIESAEASGALQGTVHAVIPHAFGLLREALSRPAVWCEMMTLHLNTKRCQAPVRAGLQKLVLHIARKHDQPADQAFPLTLDWRLVKTAEDHLEVQLESMFGPFGTTDYMISLEAVPLPGGRTFLRFGYSCRFGTAARLAMQTYLATFGSNKVGFTVVESGGRKRLVGGMRGVVERTAMRYYLAIDAWLSGAGLPAGEQFNHRLEAWFNSTERFARQLRELDKAAYLSAKRAELRAAR